MMTKNTRHTLLSILLCFVFLGACVTTPDGPPDRDLRFKHLGTLPVDVLDMSVASTYRAPLAEPHLDHDLKPTPAQVLRNWAEDRLYPRGGVMRGQFLIEEASLKREVLKTDKGLTGVFKKEQAERFVLKLQSRGFGL